jgi:hypothetical protein
MGDSIEARHYPRKAVGSKGVQVCVACRTHFEAVLWPCDAAILLARLREAERERGEARDNTLRMGQHWEDALAERDAARADAERLAEALRYVGKGSSQLKRIIDRQDVRRAALAAHDGAAS